jgi:plasmid stabilization system protein ParE
LRTRRVRFTETARSHVEREGAWWLENREHRDLFATELEKALQILALLPGAGSPYTHADVTDLRRLYLRKWAATCTTPSTTRT